MAVAFFDVDGTGVITLANLRSRLGAFYSGVPVKEFRFLLDGKPQLHFEIMHGEEAQDPEAWLQR